MKNIKIKEMVKQKYGEIAGQSVKKVSGCGCGCSDMKTETEYSVFNDDYEKIEGYVAEADLGLGCGLPTEYAGIKSGDTVVDLGSGAGNDVFVARSLVGSTGKVIGLDFTPRMIAKANQNKTKLGYENVEFRLGEIEDIPIEENSVDVIISNCVLNLVPDKEKAFSEIYRILKSEGHFCISDVVLRGELSESLQKSAEMYAGCVAGALQKEEYLEIIEKSGFHAIEVKKQKQIHIPEYLLYQYLNRRELAEFHSRNIGIFSITVVGYKI